MVFELQNLTALKYLYMHLSCIL